MDKISNKTTVKQLVEQLSNAAFNLNNWVNILELAVDDNVVIGGLVKVSGKQAKVNSTKAIRLLGALLTTLSKEVGNIE